MSFYTLLYIFGVIINFINFIDIIKNNSVTRIKLQLLNDGGRMYFYFQIFLLSFLSWILIFINFVYKTYLYFIRRKK